MNTNRRQDTGKPCPGAGTKWVPVWQRAYCRVCHSARTAILGLPSDANDWTKHRTELAPQHNIWEMTMLNIGDKVVNRFGRMGTVVEVDDLMAKVQFNQASNIIPAGWFDRNDDDRLTVVI